MKTFLDVGPTGLHIHRETAPAILPAEDMVEIPHLLTQPYFFITCKIQKLDQHNACKIQILYM